MRLDSNAQHHDPTLFAGTAEYYAKYRFPYPEGLFEHLIQVFGLDRSGVSLDLGCGTGRLAIRLAPLFEKMIGVDPDDGMLREAARSSNASGVKNVEFVRGSSWELPPLPEMLRFVTIGQSFHWMDRDQVLLTLYSKLEAEGGVAIIFQEWTGPPEYHQAEDETITKFLGERRRAEKGYYEHPKESHEAVLTRSPFTMLPAWKYHYEREQTIESAVGYLFSTSRATKQLLGGDAPGFEAEFRQRLKEAFPAGAFTLQVSVTALLGRK